MGEGICCGCEGTSCSAHTSSLTGSHQQFTPTLWTSSHPSVTCGGLLEGPQLHFMIAISFHSPVTQDEPKRHGLGKHHDQPPAVAAEVSEVLGSGKPLLPWPRQVWAGKLSTGSKSGRERRAPRPGGTGPLREWGWRTPEWVSKRNIEDHSCRSRQNSAAEPLVPVLTPSPQLLSQGLYAP